MTTTPTVEKMSRIQCHTTNITEQIKKMKEKKKRIKIQENCKVVTKPKIAKGTAKIRARKIISCFHVFMLFRAL